MMPADLVIDRGRTALACEQLRTVQSRGVAWLLAHVADDGMPAGAHERNGYYRLPWTLAAAGHRDVGAAVLSWMERNALTDEGDLREGVPRDKFVERSATYPISIIAQGAWVLERYDTALAAMNIQRQFQDPQSGGAYWERPERRVTRRQFIYPTAQLGLAALATGQRDMADAAFAWFVRMYAAQPELPRRLFNAWADSALVTNVDQAEEFTCITDMREPRQLFYNPGITAAFTARYYLATRNPQALELCRLALALSEHGTSDQYNYRESMQVCKLGWGAANAYDVDRSAENLDHLLRMAQWYFDSQASDGSWYPSGFMVPEPVISDAVMKTAEHTLWVTYMLSSLTSLGRGGPAATS
jgi:hypothetical protein